MDDETRLQDARDYVAALKGFYIHALVFVCVMTLLFAIDALTGPRWWSQWPLLGWGLGLLGHAIAVFSPIRPFSSAWEERKIKERLARTDPGLTGS
jgi:2TM domain